MTLRKTVAEHKAQMPAPAGPHFIKTREVARKLGVSTRTLKDMIDQGVFQAPIAIHRRADAWLASEVDEWILNKYRENRRTSKGLNP